MSNAVKLIVVKQKSGFIDIKCPSCGSKCPSLLQADDSAYHSNG